MDPILHLSIPVGDLAVARAFYVDTLGCRAGQDLGAAIDVWFYGLQLTLHARPDQLLAEDEQGVRHFGVTLDDADLDALLERLDGSAVRWISRPQTDTADTFRGKTSAKLADPSGNVIELKSYPDARAALG